MKKAGIIERVGSTQVEGWLGKTVFVFKLIGGSEIFAVASDLRPEVPLLRDGDNVELTYPQLQDVVSDGRHDNTVPKNTLKVLSIRIPHFDGWVL
jgi:hypothetical protein